MLTAWDTKDFHVEDPDGYVIAFGVVRLRTLREPMNSAHIVMTS
jgi:hypothetical protein